MSRFVATVTPEQHAEIVRLYIAGATYAEIAKKTGVPASTAQSHVIREQQERGSQLRPKEHRGGRLPCPHGERVIALYKSGLLPGQIAKRIDVTALTAARIIRREEARCGGKIPGVKMPECAFCGRPCPRMRLKFCTYQCYRDNADSGGQTMQPWNGSPCKTDRKAEEVWALHVDPDYYAGYRYKPGHSSLFACGRVMGGRAKMRERQLSE
jgi:transposase